MGYVHAANESVGVNISKFIIRQCYKSVLPCCCGLVFIEGHRVYVPSSTTPCNLPTLVNVGFTFNINIVNAGRCPASIFFESNVRGQPIP